MDACDPATGCRHDPREGLGSVACVCERGVPTACEDESVPSGLRKRLTRACARVERAGERPDRARRLLFATAEVTAKSAKLAGRAGRQNRISLECADALRSLFRELGQRAELYGGTLARTQ